MLHNITPTQTTICPAQRPKGVGMLTIITQHVLINNGGMYMAANGQNYALICKKTTHVAPTQFDAPHAHNLRTMFQPSKKGASTLRNALAPRVLTQVPTITLPAYSAILGGSNVHPIGSPPGYAATLEQTR